MIKRRSEYKHEFLAAAILVSYILQNYVFRKS